MTEYRFYCDCCTKEVTDKSHLHAVSLPYSYHYKNVIPTAHGYLHADNLPTTVETKMKEYDFCDDCFTTFGMMMYSGADNPIFELLHH
jgi:hypothetical protein